MTLQLELAKHRLFDEHALNAADIKLFPGSSRDASPDEMAEEVNKAISQIETGDFDLVEHFED